MHPAIKMDFSLTRLLNEEVWKGHEKKKSVSLAWKPVINSGELKL